MKSSKLSRREFLRLTGLTASAAVLASCAPKVEQTPAGETPMAGETSAPQPTAPAAVQQTTIELNGWKYQSGMDSQPTVFEMLQKDLPNVKLEVTGASTSDWYVQIKSRFQSGDVPDVVLMEPGGLLREYTPQLLPLDSYIANSPEVQQDKYVAEAWKEAQVGGQEMGIPGFLGVQSPWYDSTILEKVGVASPPANYDELKAATKAFRDAGYLPFLVGGKDGWHRLDAVQLTIHCFAPGKLYKAEAGEIPWTDPDFVKALTVWGEMFNNGVFQDGAMGMAAYPDCWDLFIQGKAGMIDMGSWATSELLPGLAEGIQDYYMPMFFPDLSGNGKQVATSGVDQLYCIPKDAKNPDVSWEVVKWLAQNDIKYTNDSGALPSRLEAVWPEALSKATDQAQLKDIEAFYESALKVATRRQLIYPDLQSGLEDASAAVASGQLSPEDALANLQKISEGITRS